MIQHRSVWKQKKSFTCLLSKSWAVYFLPINRGFLEINDCILGDRVSRHFHLPYFPEKSRQHWAPPKHRNSGFSVSLSKVPFIKKLRIDFLPMILQGQLPKAKYWKSHDVSLKHQPLHASTNNEPTPPACQVEHRHCDVVTRRHGRRKGKARFG